MFLEVNFHFLILSLMFYFLILACKVKCLDTSYNTYFFSSGIFHFSFFIFHLYKRLPKGYTYGPAFYFQHSIFNFL